MGSRRIKQLENYNNHYTQPRTHGHMSRFLQDRHMAVGTTILDINFCTNAKCGQKVLFRERAKSSYFRSAG